jgi:hypothetical protein
MNFYAGLEKSLTLQFRLRFNPQTRTVGVRANQAVSPLRRQHLAKATVRSLRVTVAATGFGVPAIWMGAKVRTSRRWARLEVAWKGWAEALGKSIETRI